MAVPGPERSAPRFDVAISYRRSDGGVVDTIESGLERWGRWPWRKSRLSVFRDKSEFVPDLLLLPSLERHFEASAMAVFVCTEASKGSPYVQAELEFWLDRKSRPTGGSPVDDLIVVADESLVGFCSEEKRYSETKSVLSPRLVELFNQQPKSALPVYIHEIDNFRGGGSDVRSELARIIGRVTGLPMDQVLRREQRRIAVGWTGLVAIALAVLSGLSVWAIGERSLEKAEAIALESPAGEDLTGTSLRGVTVTEHFTGALFDRANLTEIVFQESNGDNASFREAKLNNIDFRTVTAEDLTFSCAALTDLTQSCQGAELRNVRFDGGSILRGADFNFARLEEVSFTSVDLRKAKFVGTVGQKIRFNDVDLREVNFTQSNLEVVEMISVCYDDSTVWPVGAEWAENRPKPLGTACR